MSAGSKALVISGRGVCLGSLQFLGQVASESLSPSAKPGFIFIYLFHRLQGDLLSGNRSPCSLPESVGLPVMQGGLLTGDRMLQRDPFAAFLTFGAVGLPFPLLWTSETRVVFKSSFSLVTLW